MQSHNKYLAAPNFRLGDWTVEPARNRLARREATVNLEPRATDLLVFLARHPGEVLSREEILDDVWQERYVGEGVVRRVIAQLRKALGDDARHPLYIETISKRGYLLKAAVEVDIPTPAMREDRPFGSLQDLRNRWTEGTQSYLLGSDVRCVLISGDDELPLTEGSYVIGRGEEASIVIRQGGVSRRHARLEVRAPGATIEDLQSKNGTWVDSRRIHEPLRLRDGDAITVGSAVLVFRDLATRTTGTEPGPARSDRSSESSGTTDEGAP